MIKVDEDGNILPDEYDHVWNLGWEDSDTPHPGFGTMGAHVMQCDNCGMYAYEFYASPRVIEEERIGIYAGQNCGTKIR